MTNYLPDRFTVTDDDLVARGLYAALRAQGVAFAIAHQTIGARLLDAEEAELLGETDARRLRHHGARRLRRHRPPRRARPAPLPRDQVHRADHPGRLNWLGARRPAVRCDRCSPDGVDESAHRV